MLRSVSKTCNSLRSAHAKIPVRYQSSGPSGGNGTGTVIGATVGLIGAGAIGTVGYAYYDPEFRKSIETAVPQLKPVLQPILGEPRDASKPLANSLPSLPLPKKKESKEVEEKPKQAEKIEKKSEPVPTSASKEKKIERADKDAEIDKRLVQRDEEVKKLNQKLEKSLRSTMHTLEILVKSAQEAKDAAIVAIESHTKLLRVAVEDPNLSKKDPQWEQVGQAYETVQAALNTEKRRDHEARLELERLRKLINEGRSSKDTAENATLNEANQILGRLTFNLDDAQAKVNKAQTESKIMTEFKKLIEQGRQQFADELKSIMPNIDAKLKSGSGQKLSEDELNALIAHAHVRVDQLRRQLAEQQLRGQQHVEQALERQKAEYSKLTDDRVQIELEKARSEAEVAANEKVSQARVEFEDELRKQLRRQAAAHSEHLEDVLRAQREQLSVQAKRNVEEAILQEREIFTRQLASSVARLQAIEVALEGRADLDNANRRAKDLWLACQQLRTAIVKGRSGKDFDSRRKPLANEVMTIKEVGGVDPFVTTLVNAVPDSALSAGVYSEEDLTERFEKVHKLCRRTARIGEQGGTLVQYGLSYLQSTFIWNSTKETTRDTEIDPSKIDTFEILSRASYCVDKKDFETAVKLMMLLKGEPARIASDWVRDTRDHLETRQAAELLMAHAAAQSVRTYY